MLAFSSAPVLLSYSQPCLSRWKMTAAHSPQTKASHWGLCERSGVDSIQLDAPEKIWWRNWLTDVWIFVWFSSARVLTESCPKWALSSLWYGCSPLPDTHSPYLHRVHECDWHFQHPGWQTEIISPGDSRACVLYTHIKAVPFSCTHNMLHIRYELL